MKILLLDPDAERRGALAAQLQRRGHKVDGLAELPSGQLPSVELLMVAGPELVAAVRAYERSRRAHWILALAQATEVDGALAAGADDCLLVPFDVRELELRLTVAERHGAASAADEALTGLLSRVRGDQLRAIFEALLLPVGIVDSRGYFVQCNRELEQTFRRERGEVIGRHLTEFFTTADVQSILRTVAETGLVRDQELELLDASGERYWVYGQARWIPTPEGGYVIGSFSDVTERRTAEDALRQSEASLRSVLQASPDGIIVHARERYLFVNRTAVEQLGRSEASELVGTSIFDHVHEEEAPAIRGRTAQMLASGEPAPIRDIHFVRPDGEVFVGEVASIPATFDGEPAIISIVRDVSEQRRLQSQLFLADRLATVGTLAVGVAHEISNPLSWVVGNLGLLADEFDKQVRLRENPGYDQGVVADSRARVRELLGRAQEGSERVRRIVRDLGRFARPDDQDGQATDLHALLESTIEIAEVQVRYRAKIVRYFGATSAVRGSEARLGQVFLNLLVNAGQAIEPGAPQDNQITVSTRDRDDGQVEVAIVDTGSGIPEYLRKRIFDPFFTTKPPGEGTGIGLAICESIVSSFGGRLEVDSEVGVGTTFRVILPAADTVVPRATARSDREPSGPSPDRPVRVLVVDDEPLICEMVSDALEGHEVESATSAREAYSRILDAEWDLILCDMVMPEMSGVQLWHKLAADRPEALSKLVFMTGGEFSSDAPKLPRAREPRKLEKPFSIRSLRALVSSAGRQAEREASS